MADDFDPYRKWLGITPKDQPPHHYRLLGIELFESDPDVIEGAADRQMAHLRTFQAGPHSAASQKLLNECSAARVTLLNPEKRVEYDRQLREKLAANRPLPSGEGAMLPLPPDPQVGAPGRGEGAVLPLPPGEGRGEGASPRSAPQPQPQPLPMAIARPVSTAAPLPLAEAAPVILSANDNSGSSAYRRASRSTPLWRQPTVLGVAGALAIFAGIVFALTRGGKSPPEVVANSTSNTVAVAPAAPPQTDRSPPTKNESNTIPTTAPLAEPPPVGPAPPAPADFEILGANWGTGDKWVDVTAGVRSCVKGNRLMMIVWTKLFGDPADPAPGEGKRLSIRYRSRGNECSADYSDLWFVYLDGNPLAPPTSSPRDLELLEARYGAGGVFVDVLPRLRGHLNNGRLAVAADIFAADTAAELEQQGIGRNIYKVLWVRYRNNTGEHFMYGWNSEPISIESRSPKAAGSTVDLLKLVQVPQSIVSGDWLLRDGQLLAPPQVAARLQIPFDVPDNYVLNVTVESDGGFGNVSAGLVVGGRHVLTTIDAGGAYSGMALINRIWHGDDANPTKTWRLARMLEPGQPHTLTYIVRPTSARVLRDGAEVFRWSGDPSTLSIPGDWQVPNQRQVYLQAYEVPYRVTKAELTPLAPERAPMLIVGESGAPLDVMKAIELDRDRLHGDWQFTGQTLVTPGAEGDKLQLPAIVPESYQLDLVAEREAGSDSLTFTIPIAGAQGALSIDGWQGKLSGLEKIDDKRIDANETKHEGSIFADGKPHAIHITVRKNHVRLVCDGKPLVDWTGDVGRLKPLEAFPYKDRIYVGDWQTKYRLTNIKIRAFPGDAADGSPPAFAAETMPNETASPRLAGPAIDADLASGGVDTRLPEPDEAAQKAARSEMRKKFVAALKNAAKSVEKKRSLAEEMAQKAAAEGNQGARTYVLLKQAIDLAESAGEIELAWRIIDQLAKTFAVNELALRNESLSEIGKGAGAKSPQRAGQLTDAACRLMTAALAAGDAAALKKAATQAQSFARRTNDKDVQKEVNGRAAGAGEWAAELESVAKARETLKTSPDDPAANLAVGRFQLCALGDVDSALPKLAKSGDTVWKKLAGDELALANRRPTGPRTFVNGRLVTRSAPAEAQRELAAADAWWSRGEEEPWP
ncbi:MAG TPA: hypothetical protein VF278_04710, partial [Pirellulales bacterium]